MASRFVLQVVDVKTGEIVTRWPPGLDEEADMITDLCRRVQAKHLYVTTDLVARVQAKQVGLLYTEAHVLASVRAVLEAAHVEACGHVAAAVHTAMTELLMACKSRVKEHKL